MILNYRIKSNHKFNLIWGGVVFSILYWILESVRDVISFQKGILIERVFFPDAMTFWVRILVVCLLMLSSIYGQTTREKERKLKKEKWKSVRMNSIISIGFGFGIMYWLLTSERDAFLLENVSLVRQIFFPDAMTIWNRMLAELMIFLFSLYVYSIINE